ncbi:hypothetical protein AAMO2058_000015900 [Amorphochlora amoebiformis]
MPIDVDSGGVSDLRIEWRVEERQWTQFPGESAIFSTLENKTAATTPKPAGSCFGKGYARSRPLF